MKKAPLPASYPLLSLVFTFVLLFTPHPKIQASPGR